MTPKEKAWELMDKCMRYHKNGIYNVVHKDIAKEYALIVVDEIIDLLSHDINTLVNYWFEVKNEIEKL